MKNDNLAYNILVHCKLPQIRHGFDSNVSFLPFATKVTYADLSSDGIMSHLRTKPDLIAILLSEGDSEFGLPLKIKLFASNIPLLLVLPSVPERYHHALQEVGVDSIVELPVTNEFLCSEISKLLNAPSLH